MQTGNELVSPETIQWADGFLLVYSITDRQSFNYIKRVKQQLTECRTGNTLTVVNNVNPHGLSASGSAGNLHSGSNSNGAFGFKDSGSSSVSMAPIVLVANKADLIHLRQVSMEEGKCRSIFFKLREQLMIMISVQLVRLGLRKAVGVNLSHCIKLFNYHNDMISLSFFETKCSNLYCCSQPPGTIKRNCNKCKKSFTNDPVVKI